MSLQKQNVDPLYSVKVKCPNCTHEYKTSKVRSSFRKIKTTDSDFCIHYVDINPDFYSARVCPLCGFSHTENFNMHIKPAAKERIYKTITQKWDNIDYSGERNLNSAITAYKLALLCSQITEQSNVVIGGVCFKIACFYRFMQDTDQERRFLQFTLDCYTKFFETESGINVNEAKMMYMIAELYRQLGEYHNAAKWFNRIISDKSVTDIGIIRRAREQYQLTREQLKETE